MYLPLALTLFCRYWEYRDFNLTSTNGFISSRYRLWRLTGSIDASFTYNTRRSTETYFLKGIRYWRLSGRQNRRRRLSVGRLPDRRLINPDAAMTWMKNRAYIFKGDRYYRLRLPQPYLRKSRLRVDRGYPKSIAAKWMRCRESQQGSSPVGGLITEL